MEWLGWEKGVEEVIESFDEDVRRSDVGGEGLLVPGRWTMEGFDGDGGVDTIGPRILRKTVNHHASKLWLINLTRSQISTDFWYSRSSLSHSGHISSQVPRKSVASSSRIGLSGSGIRPDLTSAIRCASRSGLSWFPIRSV